MPQNSEQHAPHVGTMETPLERVSVPLNTAVFSSGPSPVGTAPLTLLDLDMERVRVLSRGLGSRERGTREWPHLRCFRFARGEDGERRETLRDPFVRRLVDSAAQESAYHWAAQADELPGLEQLELRDCGVKLGQAWLYFYADEAEDDGLHFQTALVTRGRLLMAAYLMGGRSERAALLSELASNDPFELLKVAQRGIRIQKPQGEVVLPVELPPHVASRLLSHERRDVRQQAIRVLGSLPRRGSRDGRGRR